MIYISGHLVQFSNEMISHPVIIYQAEMTSTLVILLLSLLVLLRPLSVCLSEGPRRGKVNSKISKIKQFNPINLEGTWRLVPHQRRMKVFNFEDFHSFVFDLSHLVIGWMIRVDRTEYQRVMIIRFPRGNQMRYFLDLN